MDQNLITDAEHKCFTDGPTCDRCGGNIALHLYNCTCDECETENYNEACDALDF